MTIRFRTAWAGYQAGELASLAAADEARLVAGGLADIEARPVGTEAGGADWVREGSTGAIEGLRLPGGQVLRVGNLGRHRPAHERFRRASPVPIFHQGRGAYSSVYWWWVVRVDGLLARPLGRYYAYYSTDHDPTVGGIALAYADSPLGPWQSVGQVFVDTVRTTSPGNAQTETPSVIWDPAIGKLRMFYQQIAARVNGVNSQGVQSTLSAVSADGISWEFDDGFRIDVPAAVSQPSDGHTGYFLPFQVRGRWVAYSLYGSGPYPHFAAHYANPGLGDWSTDPRGLGHWQHLCGEMGDGVTRYVSWNHSFAVEDQGGLLLVSMLTDFAVGGFPRNARLGVAPLSLDARAPVAGFRRIWEPQADWESGDIRSITPLVDDGVLYVYYVTKKGANFNVGVLTYEL